MVSEMKRFVRFANDYKYGRPSHHSDGSSHSDSTVNRISAPDNQDSNFSTRTPPFTMINLTLLAAFSLSTLSLLTTAQVIAPDFSVPPGYQVGLATVLEPRSTPLQAYSSSLTPLPMNSKTTNPPVNKVCAQTSANSPTQSIAPPKPRLTIYGALAKRSTY